MDTTTTTYTVPPPPPPATPPPATPPPATPWAASHPAQSGNWRDRLPELVASIGAILVGLAVTGFLASTWTTISQGEKALALAVAATVLTVAGLWADRASRLEPVLGACWAAATVAVAGSARLAGGELLGTQTRAAIAVAGLVGAAHAAALLWRRRDSLLQQSVLFGTLVYAAGPPGGDVQAAWSVKAIGRLIGEPLLGLFDVTYTSAAFLLSGTALLAVGVVWLALARSLTGRAGMLAKSLAVLALGFAALQLQVVGPVGAVAALAIVIAFLVYGVASDGAGLLAAGVTGCVLAGIRVLMAVFSGKALATSLVFAGGLAMLGWALVAVRRRQSDRAAAS